jgi:hypothetical protein
MRDTSAMSLDEEAPGHDRRPRFGCSIDDRWRLIVAAKSDRLAELRLSGDAFVVLL